MIAKALDYLNKNRLHHAGMIAPIMRGSAEIMFASPCGVLLKETKSGAYMISANDTETGKELVELATGGDLYNVHQIFLADLIRQKNSLAGGFECYQAVYPGKPLALTGVLNIKPLDLTFVLTVLAHYQAIPDENYIRGRIEDNELFGGFLEDELVGFVGIHEEGTIGMLEVFKEHRGNGFGAELEKYMINLFLDRGKTPFTQVGVDNHASLGLQKKLGMEISPEKVFWLF